MRLPNVLSLSHSRLDFWGKNDGGRSCYGRERSTQVTHPGKGKKWCQSLLCSCRLWRTMSHREVIGCGYQWTSGNDLKAWSWKWPHQGSNQELRTPPCILFFLKLKVILSENHPSLGVAFWRVGTHDFLRHRFFPSNLLFNYFFKKEIYTSFFSIWKFHVCMQCNLIISILPLPPSYSL